jgi:hypothetical protein
VRNETVIVCVVILITEFLSVVLCFVFAEDILHRNTCLTVLVTYKVRQKACTMV